uniref:Histone H4 n=1 Tax=Knipowitschia caucasica TaxID=637954 RepID=A0AAV2K0V3_KNICA
MAAGPLCPASSHNCHTSCAAINLPSLLLQHNFIKTTQERANNKHAAAVRSKRQNHPSTREGARILRRICKTTGVRIQSGFEELAAEVVEEAR